MDMEFSMDEDSLRPPERSRGDAIHRGILAALSAIPVAAELFETIFAPPLARRQDAWMEAVADGIRQLQERIEGFDWTRLTEDEAFVTIAIEASAAALRTHQAEKREALRNAVLNAA